MEEPKEQETHKIAVFGIQNAGKTSILRVLSREFDILSHLKPTIKVERTFLDILGKKLLVWDYGGQEKYRQQYLESPERYFNEINTIFYVLDIQDPSLLGSNVMYFDGLYKRIKKYSPNAQFVLLFHKLDPNLELPENAIQLQNKFLEAVKHHFEGGIENIETYRTSIYNPITLVKAFSQSLISEEEIRTNVSEILESFCKTYDLKFASALTENFFELGFYVSPEFEENYPQTYAEIFNDIHKNLENWLDPATKPKQQFGSIGVLTEIFAIQTPDSSIPLFTTLGFGSDNERSEAELTASLKELNEELVKILRSLDLEGFLKS